MTKPQLIIIGAAVLVVIIFGLMLLGIIPGLREDLGPTTNLTVWGTYYSSDIFGDVIADYSENHKNIAITYIQKEPETYETELINALALGKGPDIIMFHNTWLPKHFEKLIPLSEKNLGLAQFKKLFPTVIEQDFAPDEFIYALPLFIDTLALYYNKDYFDAKNIALPPETWEEFNALIPKLKEIDRTNKITKAAGAIGGSLESINQATDLLSLIMLQSGTKMTGDKFEKATFYSFSQQSEHPGLNAFNFYLQFANPASDYYTWNDKLHYSIDNFSEGGVAMIFNYAHQIDTIKSKNPFLNFEIAPMPQPKNINMPVNYANYWGLAVLSQSQNPEAAWDFIMATTLNEKNSQSIAQKTGKSPALRSLLATCKNDGSEIGVFCQQVLTARSWPQINNNAVRQAFSQAIELVLSGRLTAETALKQAEDEINLLMSSSSF